MLRNITHMINFANTKDDRYLKFLLPMQSMTQNTIVRRKMVKNETLDMFVRWIIIIVS
jgi:hypothetical protein